MIFSVDAMRHDFLVTPTSEYKPEDEDATETYCTIGKELLFVGC